MQSQRTFRDGCVSFSHPLVTGVKVFERSDEKSYSSRLLDAMRFNRRIDMVTPLLSEVIIKKLIHIDCCKLSDHTQCCWFHHVVQ